MIKFPRTAHTTSFRPLHAEKPAIVEARRKAVSFMYHRQWDKFCELLLSAEQADELARKGQKLRRKGRWNRSRIDASGRRSAESSGGLGNQIPTPPHDLLSLDSDHSTLLHALVTFHAPDHAIRALHRTFPSMIRSVDSNGRTPLHWAVETASLGLIDILLELHPNAANVQDFRGRTPLIQACLELSRLLGGSVADGFTYSAERDTKLQCATDLIQRLARASPRSVLIEDEEGHTALEYAINALAPRKAVGELQMVTVAVLEDKEKERRRRRQSDCRRARAEVQKQLQQESWMPQFVTFEAAVTTHATKISTSRVRIVAAGV